MRIRLPVPSVAPARPGRRMRGVTLLEILLVIALIGGAGVLTVALLGGGIDGLRLRSSGKQLAAELRQLRTLVFARGEPDLGPEPEPGRRGHSGVDRVHVL